MHQITANVLLIIFSFLLIQPPIEACTIFVLSHGSETVYGQNLDWLTPLPGLVVVNKRGIEKTVLHWKGHWPAAGERERVSWISRFGSVTFTYYGRDFIEGGMNEAGLVVDEASLFAVYPEDDGRPGVFCAQWIQYQLDNYATVEEVLNNLDDLRPDGEGWHYLIADSSGACAVIEYLEGEALVYTGDSLEVCALTNTTYAQALSHIPMDKAFGGELDIASGTDSYGRFVRVAKLLRDYDPEYDSNAIEYAFHMLKEVSVEDTRRSVVYDAGQKKVLWKSEKNSETRWLDLGVLEFSQDTPVRIIDIDSGDAGDVKAKLQEYSIEASRAVVKAILGSGSFSTSTDQELKSRGFTLEEVIELIASLPTKAIR